jgi:hypothetical protein
MNKYILVFIFFVFLIACSPQKPKPIGGDKDKHGCLGPAGFTWCEKKQKCIRPWEEKCE